MLVPAVGRVYHVLEEAVGEGAASGARTQEEDAARAYDRVSIAMGKLFSNLNFDLSFYSDEVEKLKKLPYQDVIVTYRKRDPSKKLSKFRGIYLDRRTNRYRCSVTDPNKKGKRIFVGLFEKVNLLMIVYICL